MLLNQSLEITPLLHIWIIGQKYQQKKKGSNVVAFLTRRSKASNETLGSLRNMN